MSGPIEHDEAECARLRREMAAEMDNEGHDWSSGRPVENHAPWHHGLFIYTLVAFALWKAIDILIWVWHRIHSLSS